MKCRLIAAGTRLPGWVVEGFSDYQKRLRTPLVLELHEIAVATRRAGENPAPAVQREGDDMMAVIREADYVVALEVKEISLTGIFRYANVWQRTLALLGSGKVDLKPLISASFPFDASVTAFKRAAEQRPSDVKIQITL